MTYIERVLEERWAIYSLAAFLGFVAVNVNSFLFSPTKQKHLIRLLATCTIIGPSIWLGLTIGLAGIIDFLHIMAQMESTIIIASFFTYVPAIVWTHDSVQEICFYDDD